jgi:hypothetical protein
MVVGMRKTLMDRQCSSSDGGYIQMVGDNLRGWGVLNCSCSLLCPYGVYFDGASRGSVSESWLVSMQCKSSQQYSIRPRCLTVALIARRYGYNI